MTPGANARKLDRRKLVKLLVKSVVTAGLLSYLVSTIGWRQIAEAVARADVILVVIAALVGMCARWIQACQMAAIMSQAEMPVSGTRVMLANSLSWLYAMIVPGDVVASAAKWSNLAAATGKKSGVLCAILYNRIMLLLPWLALGAMALAVHNPLDQRWLPVAAAAATALMLFVTFALYHPSSGAYLDQRILSCSLRWLPERAAEKVAYLVRAIQPFRQFSSGFHLRMVLVGVAAAIVALVSFAVMARAANVEVPILLLVWIRALIAALRLLPVSFNGLGVREATLVAVLGAYGVPEAVAFGFGVLSFVNLLAAALVGACYQIALSTGLAKWHRELPSATPGEIADRHGQSGSKAA